MGFRIQSLEILYQSDSTIFLGYREDRAVVLAPGWLNNSKFEPFDNVSLHFFHVRIRNLELFDKDRLLRPQSDLMQVGSASSQIELVFADGFMEFQQHIQVSLLVFGRNFATELLFDQLLLGFGKFLLRPGFFVLHR